MKNWEKAESKVAKVIGGKRVPGSGNGFFQGDISTKNLMVEMKETSQEHLSFHLNWLGKLIKESKLENKIPIFGMEFDDGQQKFLIRVKDRIDEIEYNTISWINNITVTLRPESLPESTLIKTIYGDWSTITLLEIKELEKNILGE